MGNTKTVTPRQALSEWIDAKCRPLITIGKYSISEWPEDGKVWLEHESGEGMACDESKLEAVIAAFYQREF